jgi:hypothetical protein
VSGQIVSVSMEDICSEVVKAATDVLKAHGMERPSVVVNFAWKEPHNSQTYAIGTAIPRRHRKMMAESLVQSAEDAGFASPDGEEGL